MRQWIAGVAFALIFYGGTMALALPTVISVAISDRALQPASRLWARWYLWCCRRILGIRMAVRGAVPQGDVIVAFKHQSAFETIATLTLFDRPAVVMKEELRHIPIWGWIAARHGSIFVQRQAGASALRHMLRQARRSAASGRPIVIFPEGTRVAPGQVAPIRAGLYALASGVRLPVVPVALDAGKYWQKGLAGKHPGIVTLAFQPEISPTLPRKAFEEAVQIAINADPVQVEVRK
ncbi:MAG: lysophospholipid acyltransferase family protein [Sphingomonadaceae bacterium]